MRSNATNESGIVAQTGLWGPREGFSGIAAWGALHRGRKEVAGEVAREVVSEVVSELVSEDRYR